MHYLIGYGGNSKQGHHSKTSLVQSTSSIPSNMNVLQRINVSVDEPAFLDAKKTVMVMSSRGSPIPEPSEPFTSTYPDYISVLEHHVIDPHKMHVSGSSYRQRVLCTELLRTQLFYSIYLRYGSRLFKIINGWYEVFQLIPETQSYLQVSGRDIALTCKYGTTGRSHQTVSSPKTTQNSNSNNSTPKSSHLGGRRVLPSLRTTSRFGHNNQGAGLNALLAQTRNMTTTQTSKQASPTSRPKVLMRTQSTPTSGQSTPSSRLRTLRQKSDNDGSVVGTHMFAFQPQPIHSPDRLFGRMTYTRWFHGVFSEIPAQNKTCHELRQLHRYLHELAVTPLVERLTGKERTKMDSHSVFDNEIPHWKIKQLIKQMMCKLDIQALFSKCCYVIIRRQILRLFSNNHHTKLSTSFLIHSVKISQCTWTGSLSGHNSTESVRLLVLWLVKLISYTIRYYFYVTESREHRKRTIFFLREYWSTKSQATLDSYISSGMLRPISNQSTAEVTSRFRFIAGQNKLRPILSTNKKSSSRYKLLDLLACLKYLSCDEASGVASTCDIARQMRKFKAICIERGLLDKNLYFVKADIHKCYDSIDRNLLIQILWKRIAEVDIDEFVCWRLAVIMSGKDKPTVTYTDHVDVNFISQNTQGQSSLFSGIREYLNKKGITSAVIVPLHRHRITAEQLMYKIRQHLESIVIEVSTDMGSRTQQQQQTKYSMVNGIPQGSILSSVLCDLYYGDMEKKYLAARLINNPEKLLMRYVDDFLLLTHEEDLAQEFLLSLLSANVTAEYNCTIKHEKTVSNITPPLGVQLEQVFDVIRWCQYNISLNDCSVSIPYHSTHDIENSVSYNGTLKPVSHIRSLMLRHISVFSNPLYFDSQVNSVDVIESNIKEILRLAAVKFCYLTGYLPDKNSLLTKRSKQIWTGIILSLAKRLHKIICNYHHRNNEQLLPSLTLKLIIRWCLEMFIQHTGSWPRMHCLCRQLKNLHRSYLN